MRQTTRASVLAGLTALLAGESALSQTPASGRTCDWLLSSGATENFRKLAVGPPPEGLRFGDFDGDGRTDVFATRARPTVRTGG